MSMADTCAAKASRTLTSKVAGVQHIQGRTRVRDQSHATLQSQKQHRKTAELELLASMLAHYTAH